MKLSKSQIRLETNRDGNLSLDALQSSFRSPKTKKKKKKKRCLFAEYHGQRRKGSLPAHHPAPSPASKEEYFHGLNFFPRSVSLVMDVTCNHENSILGSLLYSGHLGHFPSPLMFFRSLFNEDCGGQWSQW